MNKAAFIAIAVLISAAGCFFADSRVTGGDGVIRMTVTDTHTGKPIPNARIKATPTSMRIRIDGKFVTDEQGVAEVPYRIFRQYQAGGSTYDVAQRVVLGVQAKGYESGIVAVPWDELELHMGEAKGKVINKNVSLETVENAKKRRSSEGRLEHKYYE